MTQAQETDTNTPGRPSPSERTTSPVRCAQGATLSARPLRLALALLLSVAWMMWAASGARADATGFRGVVTDLLTHKPIAGARVSVGALETGTDGQGRYNLPAPPGTYDIRVQARDHITMSSSRRTVSAGSWTTVDLEMVLSAPTAEQAKELDAIFRAQAAHELSAEELAHIRSSGYQPTGVTALPATVRVVMPDGIVVVMSLDEYVKGVLPREVPPYWPAEALKAQAVAARCYAATARRHMPDADLCTTVHCQVWSPIQYETTNAAVDATHNVALTYAGSIIYAYFFAHCDGHTRNSEAVWDAALPYCRSVSCPCGFTSMAGHGVGMCQEGARVLAQQGRDYAAILLHYYSRAQVLKLPPHRLMDGGVNPSNGDSGTLFRFEVTYSGSDKPIAAHVLIDDHAYALSPAGTVSQGTLYRYATRLPVGEHRFAFHFEDGYNPAVNLPTAGTLLGPSVHAGLGPTPEPRLSTSAVEQWVQSTLADFALGSHSGTMLTASGDGEVALAPGNTTGVYASVAQPAPMTFVALGSIMQSTLPAGTAITLSLRTSQDGSSWSLWTDVPPMDAEREKPRLRYGELVYRTGEYVQYRVTLTSATPGVTPVLSAITIVFIDSRRGNTAEQAQALAIASAPASGPVIISRAAWGADEKLMTWTPEYRTIRKVVVHHTATPNNALDPAATVRAIYYYHAVTRGWGDIGYNYLIDSQGRIYEGRAGGEGVVGGHALQYAWGSIGVSLIGDYDQVDITSAMQTSLVELLAWKGNLHMVHPLQSAFFIDKELPNIMAHRDGAQTTCPGKYVYARLPAIRQAVWSRMAQVAPNVRIETPALESRLSGVVPVSVTASPPVTQVLLYVDGSYLSTDSTAPFQFKWNTAGLPEGTHVLQTRVQLASFTAEHSITVTADNTPPTGSLNGPGLSNILTVTLNTSAEGAAWTVLGDGWLWEGEDLRHQSGVSITDSAASNGLAWMGRGGRDAAGYWYGPYFGELPVSRSYRVFFRLRSPDRSTNRLATLDVSDNAGVNIYASRTISGDDLPGADYVELPLDFSYYRRDSSGLEFRTMFSGAGDLVLDRVSLFRSPRPYTSKVEWQLSPGDGLKHVAVRYMDAAGNLSPIYTMSVLLDTSGPQWGEGTDGATTVRDSGSGLRISSAQFAISSDGGSTFGEWRSLALAATEGTTATVSVKLTTPVGTHVRYRISDRAGNVSDSPSYAFLSPMPSATLPAVTPTASAIPTPTPQPAATATPSPLPPTASASPTATASPTLTASPTPATGSIRGRVLLQGRTNPGGVTVTTPGGHSAESQADGTYVLADLPPGSYELDLGLPGYLSSKVRATVTGGIETTAELVGLRAGDVNGDCVVDLMDLVLVSINYRQSPPGNPAADINNDGQVDLFDLILVSLNMAHRCS